MKQKVAKPIVLLMIAVGVCMIPMLGYYPLVQSWYGAMCNVKGLAVLGWPVMIYVILQNEGVLCAVKYGWMLGATGLFLVQYKRVSEKYNPFTVAFITTLIGGTMEAMDWFMNGMIKEELYALIPIVLLIWSTTVIFSVLIKNFMWHIQGRKNYYSRLRHQQIIRNEKMMQTSKAFKDLAIKIQNMSGIEEDDQGLMDAAVEFDINENMCKGCANGQIQYLERAKLNYLWYNKMLETREAMAIQLNEMADIIEYYTKPVSQEKRNLFGMENYLKRRLRDEKIIARRVSISENSKGKLEIHIVARKKKRAKVTTDAMCKIISNVIGQPMRFSVKENSQLMNYFNEYLFLEQVNFSTASGSVKKVKQNQEMSGDNYTYMELDSGATFMSICDGMGSGPRAEGYSEVVIDLLEQLLESGFTEQTALKLINSVLLTGNQWQEPAAVDMALFDRYSGTCQFLKMGAACTYIKRGGWVECIKSTSLPMGIFEQVDMETITKKLYAGDFIIMISDGIVDSLECTDREEAMGRIIMDIKTASPREMALEIMNRALQMSKGIPKDDMTVLCTGIWEN